VAVAHPELHVVIEPRSGWQLVNWKEILACRDLCYFLVWRDLKVRYSQSVLGIGWVLIQPLCSMLVYTFIFGRLVRMPSDGVPYPLFSFVALVPWTYFINVLNESSGSLVVNQNLITKVYFPRLILPLVSILNRMVDFLIAFALLVVLLAAYRVLPTWNVLFLPLLLIILSATGSGLGMLFAALSVQYRDVRYALHFGVQLLMYAAPVIYPVRIIPAAYRPWYALNPMVGVIEGFRASLLGTRPMPWTWIAQGAGVATLLFLIGALYFRRRERQFADLA
jgi:lipopolysaccharide transport system permease protein